MKNPRRKVNLNVLMVVVAGIGFMAACGHRLVIADKGVAVGMGRKLDVSIYGAVGDGKADDTNAIQAVIDSALIGDTVYIPKGEYLVRTLRLVPNVHIVADGLLKQPKHLSEAFSVEKQNSNAPLFRAHRVSNIYLSFRAETVNEAIYASQCSNITIANSRLFGDTANVRSFPAILWYACRSSRVVQSEIHGYGGRRQSPTSYQPGTAIRILSGQGITLSGNNIHENGENGIFIHDTGDVEVDGNHIYRNGMSGLQIAFGGANRVKNYRITNNRFEFNAADAVDINNRGNDGTFAINALIAGNYSRENGFVGGESTPDGSGIGTLIGISDVILSGNRAFGNNRPALYIERCGTITANRNYTDGPFELVGQLDSITLFGNEFPTLRLLANVRGSMLDVSENKVERVFFPNGIHIDSLHLIANEIGSGPININMDGNLKFEDNQLKSGHEAGALLLVQANSASLRRNHIMNAKNAAIMVRETVRNVMVDSNFVVSGGQWLHDEGSPNLRVGHNEVTEHQAQKQEP